MASTYQQMPNLKHRQSVLQQMEDNMRSIRFRVTTQKFLPQPALDQVTNPSVITNVVLEDDDACSWLRRHNRDPRYFINPIWTEASKLFAICIYSDFPLTFLYELLERGLRNWHLPLTAAQCPVLAFSRLFNRNFIVDQNCFTAPYFTMDSLHRLDNDCSVPINFDEDDRFLKGRGAFGEVYEVEIHADQHLLPCVGTKHAMKVCRQGDFASREQDFIEATKGLAHQHCVKCLSAFTYGAHYYMLFELANCNLFEFMESHPTPRWEPHMTVPWLFKQVHGICDALRLIHSPNYEANYSRTTLQIPQNGNNQKTGYIHDIKHQNILCFEGASNCFRLADFSCARVVDMTASVSGRHYESHKTENKVGTPTTRPPESHQGGKKSRPADVWSLGTVYLELLVWYIQGFDGLIKFRELRSGRVSLNGLDDDGFWTDVNGQKTLRSAVIRKINELSDICNGRLKALLNTIPPLLEIEPTMRPTAAQLQVKLSEIERSNDHNLVYFPELDQFKKRYKSLLFMSSDAQQLPSPDSSPKNSPPNWVVSHPAKSQMPQEAVPQFFIHPPSS